MESEKRMIPLQKRIIYAGDVFNHLMAEKRWSATEAAAFVKDFRTVDAAEVVHGRWENITGGMITLGDCSECKVRQPVTGTNYCKNCGAKMDGDGNG